MRRLNTQIPHDEEGATAVVVALTLVVLFGFGALAIDAGQLYQERRELQNGADGAVLAAAQDCADPATAGACVVTAAGPGNCEVTTAALESRIDEYADANANDGESSACVVDLASDAITVETETLAGGNGFLTHWLAGVIGTPTSSVTARATAKWGVFGGGVTLPLTFSYCEWEDMITFDGAGDPILPSPGETVYFHGQSNPSDACVGPAGQDSPGGFGWLYPDGGECQAYVDANANVDGDTGNDIPSECNDSAYLESLLGQPVLIPIFTTVTGVGSNSVYTIIGFAGLEIDGYRLSGNPAFNRPVGSPPCSGADRCISGKFTTYTAYGDDIASPGSNDFGVTAVVLTE